MGFQRRQGAVPKPVQVVRIGIAPSSEQRCDTPIIARHEVPRQQVERDGLPPPIRRGIFEDGQRQRADPPIGDVPQRGKGGPRGMLVWVVGQTDKQAGVKRIGALAEQAQVGGQAIWVGLLGERVGSQQQGCSSVARPHWWR